MDIIIRKPTDREMSANHKSEIQNEWFYYKNDYVKKITLLLHFLEFIYWNWRSFWRCDDVRWPVRENLENGTNTSFITGASIFRCIVSKFCFSRNSLAFCQWNNKLCFLYPHSQKSSLCRVIGNDLRNSPYTLDYSAVCNFWFQFYLKPLLFLWIVSVFDGVWILEKEIIEKSYLCPRFLI